VLADLSPDESMAVQLATVFSEYRLPAFFPTYAFRLVVKASADLAGGQTPEPLEAAVLLMEKLFLSMEQRAIRAIGPIRPARAKSRKIDSQTAGDLGMRVTVKRGICQKRDC
jgi:hypothetical protein